MTPRPETSASDPAPGPPVIIVAGPPEAVEAAIAEVRRAGWHVTAGFGEQPPSPGEVRSGAIETEADAAAALLSVLAGAGAVIQAGGEGPLLDRLLDDLRHLRRVDVRRGPRPGDSPVDEDARAILAILAEGRTLGDAAAQLGLSRRTADRRLAGARAALGVERTVEAVARARRLGWLG